MGKETDSSGGRIIKHWREASPSRLPDIISWGEEFFVNPASARSAHFRISITPWLKKPILAAVDRVTRRNTLVKPVQTGGSAAGELVMLFWIKFFRGFFQYNWSNDKRAKERWDSRIESVLTNCRPVAELMAIRDRLGEVTKCEVDFGKVFFRVQGAFVAENLDSDSVSLQINEEVHSWEPGHLAKARGRTTAVWNYKSFDVSNAGLVGSQYHQAYLEGTQQVWENYCPGCGKRHAMRTRWEDMHPELGGLRYDSAKAKMNNGEYNYQIIKETLRYQMPCGYVVPDDMMQRRRLSTAADYSEPREGSDLAHKSWTYDAVCVDYIDWLQLVKEKNAALRARRLGDPEQWMRYVTERECKFYDPNDAPITSPIVLSSEPRKTREGLQVPKKLRFFAGDWQHGDASKNEFPHWWLAVRDYAVIDGKLTSLLVFEGKVETDDQFIAIIDDLGCRRWLGACDSGFDTTHVYTFCLRNGINAIKGGTEHLYSHKLASGISTMKIYSTEKPLHGMLNRPPLYPYIKTEGGMFPDPREPMFWLYSKHGIRERLHWLVHNTDFRTPKDVSEDYQKHWDSEERVKRNHPRTNEEIWEWVQLKDRNDLRVCEAYMAMQVDQAGLIRDNNETKGNDEQGKQKTNDGRIQTVDAATVDAGTPVGAGPRGDSENSGDKQDGHLHDAEGGGEASPAAAASEAVPPAPGPAWDLIHSEPATGWVPS